MEHAVAKVRAESASEAKTQFLATISHEMRTPLNAILGSADLLTDGSLHVPRAVGAPDAHQRERGGAAAADHGHPGPLEDRDCEGRRRAGADATCGRLWTRCRRAGAERARAKGLDFGLMVDAALPSRVIGDPERLRQIVTNLAENAVKFTDTGSVQVDVSRLVSVPGAVPQLLVRVVDTGTGIAPEFQARIFARFAQVDGSTTRRKGGAGLGLNIVKTLVEAMGGTVSVQSQLGAGSEFRVILPLDAVSEVEKASERQSRVRQGRRDFQESRFRRRCWWPRIPRPTTRWRGSS